MAHVDYVLYETPLGYSLFNVVHQADAIGLKLKEVQAASNDLATFGKMVKLTNFTAFSNAVEALENINLITEGIISERLQSVLELNLPKTGGKKSKIVLGVSERALAGSIKAMFPGVECETPDTSVVVAGLLRGIRQHADKLMKTLQAGDISKASLGLGHAYSRAKVKFSVTRDDNHIIQAIATIDAQDKTTNQYFMRVREWYGWHFPELSKIVSDNYTFAKLILVIRNKQTLTNDKLHDLAAALGEDGEKAQAIIDAAHVSMGIDLAEADFVAITELANLVISSSDARSSTAAYLEDKLRQVAPNLQVLIGTVVASRLISHAGSLTNLAKYPASTLQILGAEKALFRALKTKSNTPKYGLIYHASAIGRASPRNKGRISRYLANKCSMASRIDVFSDKPSTKFGEAFKRQTEERLQFYADGTRPTKNSDVMKAVMEFFGDAGNDEDDVMNDVPSDEEDKKDKKKKKSKKEKKRKRDEGEAPAVSGGEEEAPVANGDESEKKDKKKKKSKKPKATDNE